jgi:hypothetical protein
VTYDVEQSERCRWNCRKELAEVVAAMVKKLDLHIDCEELVSRGCLEACFVLVGRGICWQDKIRTLARLLKDSSYALGLSFL